METSALFLKTTPMSELLLGAGGSREGSGGGLGGNCGWEREGMGGGGENCGRGRGRKAEGKRKEVVMHAFSTRGGGKGVENG